MAPPDPSPSSANPAHEAGSTSELRTPLLMKRIALEKLWGGRALERVLGITLDKKGPVGETWELVDRSEENSTVRGGPHDGTTLRDLVATQRESLLGDARPTAEGRFPILIKYLSASKPLSVQVHPDDRTAQKMRAGESGKTESWFILDAEKDSLVYLGLREGVDPSSLSSVAAGPGIVDLLQPWPVRAGQFVHVPAGTLHAIGEGITLVEVQQNSDVTYRLYDWGRKGLDGNPRETHVDQGLLAIRYGQPIAGPVEPEFEVQGGDNRSAQLVETEHYNLSLHEIGSSLEFNTMGRALACVLVEGTARIRLPESEDSWPMETGDTWLVPAAVGALRVECMIAEGTAKLIAVETRE